LEDELGGSVRQREVAQFIQDDELGAGVAANDPSEFTAALGLLQLVGQTGERGEADASSLVTGADRQGGRYAVGVRRGWPRWPSPGSGL
jgi:hypothetical protein